MNGLEHQEQNMWDAEMSRIEEYLQTHPHIKRENYMEAYTHGIKFVATSDEALEYFINTNVCNALDNFD